MKHTPNNSKAGCLHLLAAPASSTLHGQLLAVQFNCCSSGWQDDCSMWQQAPLPVIGARQASVQMIRSPLLKKTIQ